MKMFRYQLKTIYLPKNGSESIILEDLYADIDNICLDKYLVVAVVVKKLFLKTKMRSNMWLLTHSTPFWHSHQMRRDNSS